MVDIFLIFIGADNDVDDTSKWLARQKKKEKEKKAAEKRAKMLEELDNDFGVGNIVKEDASKTKASSYGSGNLAGITVQHDANKFHAGNPSCAKMFFSTTLFIFPYSMEK